MESTEFEKFILNNPYLRIKDLLHFSAVGVGRTFNFAFQIGEETIRLVRYNDDALEISFQKCNSDIPTTGETIWLYDDNTKSELYKKIHDNVHFLELEVNNHFYVNFLAFFCDMPRAHVFSLWHRNIVPVTIPFYGKKIEGTESWSIKSKDPTYGSYCYQPMISCRMQSYLNIEKLPDYELELLQIRKKDMKDFLKKLLLPTFRSNFNYFNENYGLEDI